MAPGIRSWKTKHGTSYQARTLIEGKTVTRTFARAKEAENWLNGQKADVSRGVWVDPAKGKQAFREYGEEWSLSWVTRSKNTKKSYRSRLGIVNQEIGDLPVAKITRATISRYIAKLQEAGYSQSRIADLFQTIFSVLEVAVEDDAIRKNPLRGKHQRPAVLVLKKGERPVLTPPEVMTLATETGHYETLVVFMAFSGLRAGEVCALRYRDLNLLQGVVLVRQNFTEGELGPTKGKRHRDVHLAPWLIELLEDHIERHPGRPDELVFHDPEGRRLTVDRIRKAVVKPAVRRLIECEAFPPEHAGFTPHDLRHTFTSLLEESGVHEWEIARQLGHRSLSTSLGYSHRQPRRESVVGQALEQFRPTA